MCVVLSQSYSEMSTIKIHVECVSSYTIILLGTLPWIFFYFQFEQIIRNTYQMYRENHQRNRRFAKSNKKNVHMQRIVNSIIWFWVSRPDVAFLFYLKAIRRRVIVSTCTHVGIIKVLRDRTH